MKPLPMLALPAAPFDSADYLFEIKWDGIRALAGVEDGRWRLWGRQAVDYTPRYPELAVLGRLPSGTVVDGELVVLRQGRAHLPALLQRHQRCWPVCSGYRVPAVTYVVFDLLCDRGRSVLQEPLLLRRWRLRELLLQVNEPSLLFSEGVMEAGREFFARAVAQGHEGVMAKHLASRYWPGKRSPAWRKLKPVDIVPCVVVGYRLGRTEPHLLLAAARQGVLRYVGDLKRGFTAQDQAELKRLLALPGRSHPIVSCPGPACWLEPERYCRVQFQDWAVHGRLRRPVFRGWIDEP